MTDLIDKLRALPHYLNANILGQPEPIKEISDLLRRSFLGLRYPGRPICSMLLLGATGVGKTEIVNLFTRHLFPDAANKLVRLDCSEFQNQNSLGLLIGNSVGERGLLGFHHWKSDGSGVILFDEIEKAHPLVIDILLQILSAGRFTLADGETLDLSNYVIAATTNIGGRMLQQSRATDRETLERRTLSDVATEMRPETFARFNLRCVFNKLDRLTLNRIGAYHAGQCVGIINSQGHNIQIGPTLVEHIQNQGYDAHYGARPMQETAMNIIGGVVAGEMLRTGGQPVSGVIHHEPRTNRCFLKSNLP